jgi:hypothetical protein
MFVHALDSRIEERKANIARLETTERDIEESISIKEKHVKRLLKKIGIMEDFLELQEDLEDAKETMGDIESTATRGRGCQRRSGGESGYIGGAASHS